MSSEPASGRSLRAVRTTAILASGALLVAALADVDQNSASIFGVEGPTCPLGSTFGEESCPGCGLTRSVSFAVQGEVAESFAMHPSGVAIAFLLVGTAAVSAHAWATGRLREGHRRFGASLRLTFLVALTLGSIWRLVRD
ncbi:MAG: DUF2752 domain-containing protein [Planctomycetota bacterium]